MVIATPQFIMSNYPNYATGDACDPRHIKTKRGRRIVFNPRIHEKFQILDCKYLGSENIMLGYGRNKAGKSVAFEVRGYKPYFFIGRQSKFTKTGASAFLNDLDDLYQSLESFKYFDEIAARDITCRTMKLAQGRNWQNADNAPVYCPPGSRIRLFSSWCYEPELYKTYMGWTPEEYKEDAILAYVENSSLRRNLSLFFRSYEYEAFLHKKYATQLKEDCRYVDINHTVRTYEGGKNGDETVQDFFLDRGILHGSWVFFNKLDTIFYKDDDKLDATLGLHRDISVVVAWNKLYPIDLEEDMSIAPYVTTSLDIEVVTDDEVQRFCRALVTYKEIADYAGKYLGVKLPKYNEATDGVSQADGEWEGMSSTIDDKKAIEKRNRKRNLAMTRLRAALFAKQDVELLSVLEIAKPLKYAEFKKKNPCYFDRDGVTLGEETVVEEVEEVGGDVGLVVATKATTLVKNRGSKRNGNGKVLTKDGKGELKLLPLHKRQVVDTLMVKTNDTDPIVIICYVVSTQRDAPLLDSKGRKKRDEKNFDKEVALVYLHPRMKEKLQNFDRLNSQDDDDDENDVWGFKNMELITFTSELDMLVHFNNDMKMLGTEHYAHHNGEGFDMGYIWQRVQYLKEQTYPPINWNLGFGIDVKPKAMSYARFQFVQAKSCEKTKRIKNQYDKFYPCFVTGWFTSVDTQNIWETDHTREVSFSLNAIVSKKLSYTPNDVKAKFGGMFDPTVMMKGDFKNNVVNAIKSDLAGLDTVDSVDMVLDEDEVGGLCDETIELMRRGYVGTDSDSDSDSDSDGKFMKNVEDLISNKFAMKKIEFKFSESLGIWENGGKRLWIFVKYCMIDAKLPIILAKKFGKISMITEMARLCNVSMNKVYGGGVQNKVVSKERLALRTYKNGEYLYPDYLAGHEHHPDIWYNKRGVKIALFINRRLRPYKVPHHTLPAAKPYEFPKDVATNVETLTNTKKTLFERIKKAERGDNPPSQENVDDEFADILVNMQVEEGGENEDEYESVEEMKKRINDINDELLNVKDEKEKLLNERQCGIQQIKSDVALIKNVVWNLIKVENLAPQPELQAIDEYVKEGESCNTKERVFYTCDKSSKGKQETKEAKKQTEIENFKESFYERLYNEGCAFLNDKDRGRVNAIDTDLNDAIANNTLTDVIRGEMKSFLEGKLNEWVNLPFNQFICLLNNAFGGYEGGRVVEPLRLGLIRARMSVPDFNSLYPWLMASLYLCKTNLLTPVSIEYFGLQRWEYRCDMIGASDVTYCGYEVKSPWLCDRKSQLNKDDSVMVAYWKPDSGNLVKIMVQDLYAKRCADKKQMKAAIDDQKTFSDACKKYAGGVKVPNEVANQLKNPLCKQRFLELSPSDRASGFKEYCELVENAFDVSQLVKKIILNSIYGAAAMKQGRAKLPCCEIAASTTAAGREQNERGERCLESVDPTMTDEYLKWYAEFNVAEKEKTMYGGATFTDVSNEKYVKLDQVQACKAALSDEDRLDNVVMCDWMMDEDEMRDLCINGELEDKFERCEALDRYFEDTLSNVYDDADDDDDDEENITNVSQDEKRTESEWYYYENI